MKFCPECGAKREDEVAACTACGHAFAGDATAAGAGPDEADEAAAPEDTGAPAWATRSARGGGKGVDKRVLLAGAAVAAAVAMGAGLWTSGVFKGFSSGASAAAAAAEPAVLDLDLLPVAFGEKCGFVDAAGKLVINPQYDGASFFAENTGLAPVSMGGKWGLINRRGEYVVNPQFDSIGPAGNRPIFRVSVGDRWGTIDRKGAFVINPQFDWLDNFDAEGRARVRSGEKVGIVDQTGKYVVPPQFDAIFAEELPNGAIRHFVNGLAPAMLDGKWGYINESGAWVVNPQFAAAGMIEPTTGLAPVMVTQVKEVQDTASERAWEADVAASRSQAEYWGYPYTPPERPDFTQRTETSVWGFIDKTGKLVIQPQFAGAEAFTASGLAPVKVADLWGYIDAKGAFKVNPQFAYGRPFARTGSTWLAVVAMKSGEDEALVFGAVDLTGTIKINPQFSGLDDFDEDGRAVASLGENTGVIDTAGRYVINPAYAGLVSLSGTGDYLFMKSAGTGSTEEIGRLDRTGKVLSTVRGSFCAG
jgi:hypothetical protein